MNVHTHLAVIPGAPIIVSDLGGQASEAKALRAAVLTAARWLLSSTSPGSDDNPASGAAIGIVYLPRARDYTAATGSLHPWGSALSVGEGNFLPELLARWVLIHASPNPITLPTLADASSVHVFPSIVAALTAGCESILVVADGPSGLTADSPIGFKPEAEQCNAYCARLGSVDSSEVDESAAISAAAAEACGWADFVLWQELHTLLAMQSTAEYTQHYCAAPFGIGYHVYTMVVEASVSNSPLREVQ